MILKHECVRATMLYLERNLTLNNIISSPQIEIEHYSKEDVAYTIKMLKEAGFIKADYCGHDDIQIYAISSLTWEGHQFLDNIRDNKVWTKTKSILSKFTSTSLQIISNVASQVIINSVSKSI